MTGELSDGFHPGGGNYPQGCVKKVGGVTLPPTPPPTPAPCTTTAWTNSYCSRPCSYANNRQFQSRTEGCGGATEQNSGGACGSATEWNIQGFCLPETANGCSAAGNCEDICTSGTWGQPGGLAAYACEGPCPVSRPSQYTGNCGTELALNAACTPSCNAGYYRSTSALTCSTANAALSWACHQCGTGYYSAAGADSCTQCARGHKCTTTAQTACTGNEFQTNGGQTSCRTSDAGYYRYSSGQHDAGQTQCTPGHYCPAGSSSQTPCPHGQYQPSYAQASCIAWTNGGNCGASQWRVSVASTTADVVCQTLTTCHGHQYIATAHTTDSDRVCADRARCDVNGAHVNFQQSSVCPATDKLRSGITASGPYCFENAATCTSSNSNTVSECCETRQLCSTNTVQNGAPDYQACDSNHYVPTASTERCATTSCSISVDQSHCCTAMSTCSAYNCPDQSVVAPSQSNIRCVLDSAAGGSQATGDAALRCTTERCCTPRASCSGAHGICPEGHYLSHPNALCPTEVLDEPNCVDTCCDPVSTPNCPSDHFCPAGNTLVNADLQAPLDCPAGTYRTNAASDGNGDRAASTNCSPCPVGTYCVAGQPPVACPAGRYRDTTGAQHDGSGTTTTATTTASG